MWFGSGNGGRKGFWELCLCVVRGLGMYLVISFMKKNRRGRRLFREKKKKGFIFCMIVVYFMF